VSATDATDAVQLARTGHEVLFTHAALWGAAALCEAAGRPVTIRWSRGLQLDGILEGVGVDEMARIVHERAVAARAPTSWIQAPLPHEPQRGLLSPRLKRFPDLAAWQTWQAAREAALDAAGDALDLAMVAALGQPSWWHLRPDRTADQDAGASRLEMQPRNQGSEFVGTRLRKLADSVSARSVEEVARGLVGTVVRDDESPSPGRGYSAANLQDPGPVDSALAWTAMWGLSVSPVVQQVRLPARTPGHAPWQRDDPPPRAGHFVVPLWQSSWTIARLRMIVASGAAARIGRAVATGVPVPPADAAWLSEHGVERLVLMPVEVFGSAMSPERRARPGVAYRLTGL